ncbi:MAG: type III pantothenate kinase [Candidatus Pacearchaeota archaeon]
MRLLCLDIGNSRIKAAIFNNGAYESGITFSLEDDIRIIRITFEQWIHDKNIKHIGVSNVKYKENERLSFFTDFTECVIWEIHHRMRLPFKMLYKTPETLGTDRICAIAGAYRSYPNQPLLVVDVGTAITYDFLNELNEYVGGAITPGMYLKFKALHQYTAKLPLITFNENFPFIGQSTEESIRTGVQTSTIAEIEGMIARYQAISSVPLKIILTGGDATFISNYLTCEHLVDPHLVLKGIDFLVRYALY